VFLNNLFPSGNCLVGNATAFAHPTCWPGIRVWKSLGHDPEMDVNTAHRLDRFTWPGVSRAALVTLAVWITALGPTLVAKAGREQVKLVRVGISSKTCQTMNLNDLKAAMTVWTAVIIKQCKMVAEPEVDFLKGENDVLEALEQGRFDAIAMTTREFFDLPPRFRPDHVIVSSKNNKIAERYVLLVRKSSGVESLEKLKGQRILLLTSRAASLASEWMATLLASRSMGGVRVSGADNAMQAVLQVFFGKAGGCVVTLSAFETVCELNPQVRRELRVLASSPEVVPSLFIIPAVRSSEVRNKFESAILNVDKTAAGKQILTVFHCDSLKKAPISSLASTERLLAEYSRLKSGRNKNKHSSPGKGRNGAR
jgi:ABC-type phosphate/phosphonate transport system substrate-binding protein